MKKDNGPLIVAVFLVIGGLLSGATVLNSRMQGTEVLSNHRNNDFFISIARGAENAAALFGARTLSSITAVSANGGPYSKVVFSPTLGAIKDPGTSIQASSPNQ